MTSSSPQQSLSKSPFYTTVEIVDELSITDLYDLCDVTDAAIEAGGGFGWITPPARDVLERYWKGVMVVPERHLLVARMDGQICGAAQLVTPSRYNEAQAFAVNILACFVAPWARGHGAGRKLLETAEKLAAEMGYKVLQIDVRETQTAALKMFESMDYKHWGTNPAYAFVEGRMIAGLFFNKMIRPQLKKV